MIWREEKEKQISREIYTGKDGKAMKDLKFWQAKLADARISYILARLITIITIKLLTDHIMIKF